MAYVTMVKHDGKPVMVIQFEDTKEIEDFKKETGKMHLGASGDIYKYLNYTYKSEDYNGPSSDD